MNARGVGRNLALILLAHGPSDVVAGLALGTVWLLALPTVAGESRWRDADTALPPR